MGVYIDMDTPKSCADCPICYDELECPISRPLLRFERGAALDDFQFTEERHPACPLKDLSACGDPIERAALWVEINRICDRRDAGIITDLACLQQILSAVRHAPTIVQTDPAKEADA